MIGSRILKQYGFNSINEYFDYIYNSLINGNIQQTRDLINDLSNQQKKDLYVYFLSDLSNLEIRNKLILFLIEDLTR